MSNLMQPSRGATRTMITNSEGFRCTLCGGLFGKCYLLRSHQQKVHGLVQQNEEPKTEPSPPSVTTVIIPAIKTPAMAISKARGEIPFAVLHMIDEIPLIVRVLDQGEYSILKAAEKSDFRESQQGGPGLDENQSVSIAVVATIYQRVSPDGNKYFAISAPVSCYQTQAPSTTGRDTEERNGVMQDSIGCANLLKTLTQLNAPDIIAKKVPSKTNIFTESHPSTSGANQLKRKYNRKVSLPPLKRPPKQPKVITVVDGLQQWDTGKRSRTTQRNFQDIATGSLLSPKRAPAARTVPPSAEPIVMDEEDPFASLNVLDLIQVEDEILPQRMVIGDLSEEIFLPIV
ncbi:uncharacterized protein LOC131432523 [Malaya genurostris]|uniref:uncharacterized protein LOC131432523 n=1 Tax=Malaya genurostris TaxID=325434 RepID=UPI0026F3BF4F|nr:uncharacterized protein LOC131432523 [Malaya genurostris]XP_058454836.1 uncharacterized protein LOC131432523 [Malaya genurostris]XP_058454837.1 uncharacterized protein LOC131432523 [Malaya genurostris]